MSNDTFTIEDAKQFIVDGKKKQEDFRLIADQSWNEIEKRNKLGKLYGGSELDRGKRWSKFPLWWSCWKIRQPITLARMPIPVVKDTQGDDPFAGNPDIRRNDPCPCGSGDKYKHCHGAY